MWVRQRTDKGQRATHSAGQTGQAHDVNVCNAIAVPVLIDRPWIRDLITAAALAGAATVHAGVICQWTDDTGRTHFAQVVPDKYKKVARCTDAQKFELSPEQERAAQQRLAQDRARARADAAKPAAPSASSAPPASSAASQARAKRPAQNVTDATECPTWWRLYDESVDCFGPFRTTRGAIKVEALDVCNVVASPEPKCGPRRN